MKLSLDALSRHIAENCTECGACLRTCAFLTSHGTPGKIARQLQNHDESTCQYAFECSLCGMCDSVCPEGLTTTNLFLEMRRMALASGSVDLKRYRPILNYEKVGNSKLFAFYGLPEGCDTVFFPGCTLPGTRSVTTWKLYLYLQERISQLGVVLDCCHKPSHDLGRQDYFEQQLGEICSILKANGIRRIIVACPNCFRVFSNYAGQFNVISAYEIIAQHGLPEASRIYKGEEYMVHDPCPLRQEGELHKCLRTMIHDMGIEIKEAKNNKKHTLCCGEGGAVACVRPDYAAQWAEKRTRQAVGRKIITYCAGCAGFLSSHNTVAHFLDMVFLPDAIQAESFKPTRSPLTYVARLRLKGRLKKALKM